jgi:hypothetical protein
MDKVQKPISLIQQPRQNPSEFIRNIMFQKLDLFPSPCEGMGPQE